MSKTGTFGIPRYFLLLLIKRDIIFKAVKKVIRKMSFTIKIKAFEKFFQGKLFR
jgi:hypothetical protein